ncbi:primase-helicase family protein [Pseudomonadota bacterium]
MESDQKNQSYVEKDSVSKKINHVNTRNNTDASKKLTTVTSGAEESEESILQLGVCQKNVKTNEATPWNPSWAELVARLKQAAIGDKDGSYFTRCAFNDNARSNKNALESHLLILDGDSTINAQTGEITDGAPNPIDVYQILVGMEITHCIYTSHSNVEKGHRYRVLIPVRFVKKQELETLVDWTIGQLHEAGVYINPVNENKSFASPWYFPRVPNQERLEKFVCYEHTSRKAFPKSEALAEVMTSTNIALSAGTDTDLNVEIAALTAVGKEFGPKLQYRPIEQFNRNHHERWMFQQLVKNGYEYKGQSTFNERPLYKFLPPSSTTGCPGVNLLFTENERWRVYSHHGAHDPLSGKAEDAFALYVRFDHDGDRDAALDALYEQEPKVTMKEVWACNPATDHLLVNTFRQQQLQEFDKYHGVVTVGGKGFVITHEYKPSLKRFETIFQTHQAMEMLYKNQLIPEIKFTKARGYELITKHTVYTAWLANKGRRTYTGVDFLPTAGMVARRELPKGGQSYNLYLGSCFKPVKGDCSLILKHIKEVWCSGDEKVYDYVLKWLARMIQKSGLQGETSIVLKSAQGAGKNCVLDIFVEYYGVHAAVMTKNSDLAGEFNDHLGASVFAFSNEAVWGGNKQQEGTLKAIITDPLLKVNRKHVPKFDVKNCTHLVMASNADWVAPTGLSDRRMLILELDESKINQKVYFNRLYAEKLIGGDSAFIYYLANEVDLSGFDVRRLPIVRSSAKMDQILQGLNSTHSWIIDVLAEEGFAYNGIEETVNGALIEMSGNTPRFKKWPENQPLQISTYNLFNCYDQKVRGHEKEGRNTMVKRVEELLGLTIITKQVRSGGSRNRVYRFPSLSDARRSFEDKVGMAGPWADASKPHRSDLM